MNLKALFILLLLLSNLHQIKAADQYKVGDTLYVWAKSGLNIRSAPSVKSSKLGKLSRGEAVIIQSISDKKFNIQAIHGSRKEKNPFILKGTWVKVLGDELEGYVIDIYLLKYPTPSENMDFIDYMQSLQTEPLKIDTTWQSPNKEVGLYPFSVDAVSSIGMEFHLDPAHRLYYYGDIYDLYYREAMVIPDMSIEEGFVFAGFFTMLQTPIEKMIKRPEMRLDKNLAERLVLTENDSLKVYFSKKKSKLSISVNLSNPVDGEALISNLYAIEEGRFGEEKVEDASKYLELDRITKSYFNSSKEVGTMGLEHKSELVSYKDSTIYVQLGNDSVLTFTNNSCTCESAADYSYEGYSESLRAFVISATFWEEYSSELIDSYNGEVLFSSGDWFHISPQQKNIVSICPLIYEDGTEFSFSRIDENKKIQESSLYISFTNWEVAGNPKWLDDSTFVVSVLFKPFRDENGTASTNYKYLRIRIL